MLNLLLLPCMRPSYIWHDDTSIFNFTQCFCWNHLHLQRSESFTIYTLFIQSNSAGVWVWTKFIEIHFFNVFKIFYNKRACEIQRSERFFGLTCRIDFKKKSVRPCFNVLSCPWYSMSWIVIGIDSIKVFTYYLWWYYLVCGPIIVFDC